MRSSILALLANAAVSAAFGTANYASPQPTSTGSSNTTVYAQNSSLSHLLSEIPKPSPGQTLGSYFDMLLGSIFGPRDLVERHLIRSQTLLTSSWAQGQGYFNISLDRCLEFDTVVGIYTSKDGTRDNATLLDINKDLRTRLATNAENEQEIGSRVLDNAQRAVNEAETYLQTAICGYTVGTNAHDELRRLLAGDGYWVALMTKSIIYGGVGTGIYTGILNRNASIGQAIGVTLSAAGLTIVDGVIGRLQGAGRLSFLEANIINTFTAWYRQAVRIGSYSQGSTCISENVVRDALGSLADSSDPSFYFDSLSEIELAQMCRR